MTVSTKTVITAFPLVVFALTALTFLWPMKARVRTKARWAMWLLFCASRGVVYKYLGGAEQAPSLPEPVLWFWDWACSGLYLLFAFSLFWWVRRARHVVLPLAAWGLAALGMWNALILPEPHVVEVCRPDLPAELDGYRIAQLTDLHCCSSMRRWRTQGIVERINALKPDVICLTGDYVDGRFAELSDDMAPLKDLKAPDGIYWTTGNHEFFLDWTKWNAWYRRCGFRFLVNECVFPRKGLALGGVNDYQAGIKKYNSIPPDVAKTFRAATNGEYRVLLQHRPKFIAENFGKHRVDLQLSGHTHGGLCPVIKQVIALKNEGYVRGLYSVGTGHLYVSPGVGQWAGFPLRIFDPSEVTLLILRRK